MNWNDIKIRKYGSMTTGTKEDDGLWKIVVNMTEDVSFDGVNFESRKLEKMSIDKDFENAFKTCQNALYLEFMDVTSGLGTLFKELLVNDSSALNLPTPSESDNN